MTCAIRTYDLTKAFGHTPVLNGISLINLDGLAPASQWEELSSAPMTRASGSPAAEASR